MSQPALDPQDVQAQVERICEHKKLFGKSANLQELLRFLVKRRMSGDDDLDHYTSKRLSWDFFGRDSSIGKVEGNKLRKRLHEYYQGGGKADPILIQIPSGPYRPEIMPNPVALPELAGKALEFVMASIALMSNLDTAPRADQLLDEALKINPNHPRVLSIRAKFYADAAFFEDCADIAFFLGHADKLVDEGRRQGIVTWEMLYAEAAVEAILRWNWGAAENAFRRARAINSPMVSRGHWYLWFLISQNRVEEASELVFVESVRQVAPSTFLYEHIAWLEAFAGRPSAGIDTLRRLNELVPSTGVSEFLPFLLEAIDNPQAALDLLVKDEKNGIDRRLKMAVGAVCAGQLGRRDDAQLLYDRIRSADAQVANGVNGPFTSSFPLGIAAIGMNDLDLAVEWLAKCARVDRHPSSLLLHVFPTLRHLKDHPGFRALLEEMGLAPPKQG